METPEGKRRTVRVRRSREEIEGIVAAFAASGQSRREFASSRGLSAKSLNNWLRKSPEGPRGGSFREVVVKAESERAAGTGGAGHAAVVVRMAGGAQVELPLCAGLGWIERLVRELVGR